MEIRFHSATLGAAEQWLWGLVLGFSGFGFSGSTSDRKLGLGRALS